MTIFGSAYLASSIAVRGDLARRGRLVKRTIVTVADGVVGLPNGSTSQSRSLFYPASRTILLRFYGVGAGGSGAGSPAPAGGSVGICSGGGAGAYFEAVYPRGSSGWPVLWLIVGLGGVPSAAGSGGIAGGTTRIALGGAALYGEGVGGLAGLNATYSSFPGYADQGGPNLVEGSIFYATTGIRQGSPRGAPRAKSSTVALSGTGARSFFGDGGIGRVTQGDGNNATTYGAGGGGGLAFGGGAAVRGGNGGDGVIVVEEYE